MSFSVWGQSIALAYYPSLNRTRILRALIKIAMAIQAVYMQSQKSFELFTNNKIHTQFNIVSTVLNKQQTSIHVPGYPNVRLSTSTSTQYRLNMFLENFRHILGVCMNTNGMNPFLIQQNRYPPPQLPYA